MIVFVKSLSKRVSNLIISIKNQAIIFVIKQNYDRKEEKNTIQKFTGTLYKSILHYLSSVLSENEYF